MFPSLSPPLISPGCPVDRHLLGEDVGELHQQPRLEHPVSVDLPLHLLILGVCLLHTVFGVQLGVAPRVDVIENLQRNLKYDSWLTVWDR